MKFKYIIIVLSLASILVLYFLSGFSQPISVPLSAVPSHEGKQVIVSGMVTDYRTTTFGAQLITIRSIDDNNSLLTLYIEGEISVEYGDVVQATGVVQQYKNSWEVVVDNVRFVTILRCWDATSFPLWQLAQNPSKYLDTNVNVTGVVDSLSDSTFSLHDQEGTYALQVYGSRSFISPLSKGDLVAVNARFLYDATALRYIMKITETAHGIIVLRHGSNA